MAQKTEIQYVGQFYVYGSEAKQVEVAPKWTMPKLPKIPLEKLQRIYIDPVALCGLSVAVLMLVVLVMGAYHLRDTRAEYDRMNSYVSELKRENARLSHTYHTSYDLDEIRADAERIGMVPLEEADGFTVFFSVPAPAEKPTRWDNFVWLLSHLFDNAKR